MYDYNYITLIKITKQPNVMKFIVFYNICFISIVFPCGHVICCFCYVCHFKLIHYIQLNLYYIICVSYIIGRYLLKKITLEEMVETLGSEGPFKYRA